MKSHELLKINTLGALKASGYQSVTIKEELRKNLIDKITQGEKMFEGVLGYEDTVLPDIERAILSRHNINLLGLRGQAKTRIARQMVQLLDPFIPIVRGSELNDDPMQPISRYAIELIEKAGNETPIDWLPRESRYAEKLATPDVSVADLIGDIDPIKAANLKLSFADERVIHFGIIPRSNRSIFVINELPDLQARIQVALFNILQEGDIQIRGFKLRIPLDIQFVFTANPEDYTNRGSIVTPLKDRIGSQILTHYPKSIDIGKQITAQEARVSSEQKKAIAVPEILATLIEQVAIEARTNEYVDAKSGVSARLTISAYENLVSAAERRMLRNREKKTSVRMSDLAAVVPAINGKIELVYEGEQEGAAQVAQNLISKAIRTHFISLFPDPSKLKKKKQNSPYQGVIDWFAANEMVDFLLSDNEAAYREKLDAIPALDELLKEYAPTIKGDEKYIMKEFILHGLAEHSQIGKSILERAIQFKDLFGSMFNLGSLGADE